MKAWDDEVGGGKCIVPWSSRSARPEGVWRSAGRGFSVGEDVETDLEGGYRLIDGIFASVRGTTGELMECL